MPLVKFGQKGYSGSSMSNRAVAAYEIGEMPKSKWSKTAILNAVIPLFGGTGKTGKFVAEKLKKNATKRFI